MSQPTRKSKRPVIRRLSEETINRIAAGEVVAGPYSVVKELLENALDAGAGRVEVDVEGGGSRLIRVVDDGCGMSRDEAELALERHATSKLESAHDLHSIRTMGFRGEALPSIASVSKMVLISRRPDEDSAISLEFRGGKLEKDLRAAARIGTRIEVHNLFFNTPARRKFQRSPASESAAIRDLVADYVVARPDVAFRLTRERELSLTSPGGLTTEESLDRVLAEGESKHFLPLAGEVHPALPFTVSGFLSTPEIRRGNSRGIRLFVNQRPFYSPEVCRGLKEAYRNFLPKGRWPAAFLFFDADPRAVDVNVHPTKKEVRFTGFPKLLEWLSTRIRASLEAQDKIRFTSMGEILRERPEVEADPSFETEGAAIEASPAVPEGSREEALEGSESGPEFSGEELPISALLEPAPAPGAEIESSSAVQSTKPSAGPSSSYGLPAHWKSAAPKPKMGGQALARTLFDPAPYRDLGVERPDLVGEASHWTTLGISKDQGKRVEGKLFPHGVRILGQVFDSFLLITDEKSLYTVDQHVAHERVLFEYFQRTLSEAPPVQNLLVPHEIPLRPGDFERLQEQRSRIERYGFRLYLEEGKAWVEAFPLFPKQIPTREILADMVEGMGELFARDRLHDEVEAMADMMSCKAAIKAGERMSPGEMRALLDQLFDCDYPLTCPHGRPILLGTEESEIRRRFDRSG